MRGIGGYGNAVGVPTVGGEVEFAGAYSGNPLVNAMCVGLIRTEDLVRSRATGEGNLVVLLGSKTGRDGIHGATFASDELTEESESRRSNVQVGDPFAEKMLIECCLKLLEEGLLVSSPGPRSGRHNLLGLRDGREGGVGIEIEADRVPLRESGMEPYEVVISESQGTNARRRRAGKSARVLALAERYGLVGAVIGRVAGHGELRGRAAARSSAPSPPNTSPTPRSTSGTWSVPPTSTRYKSSTSRTSPEPGDYNEVLLKMLAHPNLCSRRSIFEQYDHGGGRRYRGAAGGGRRRDADKRHEARLRHDHGRPWPSLLPRPERRRRRDCRRGVPQPLVRRGEAGRHHELPQLRQPGETRGLLPARRVHRGMAGACEALGTPVVSGNVSLYNETEAGAVYPTPVVGMVGVFEDVSRHATPAFKREGDVVVVLGRRAAGWVLLAGSDYLDVVTARSRGRPPRPDLAAEKEASDLVRDMIRSGLVDTAHDLSGGGRR